MRSTARPRRVAEGRASSVAAKVDCRCEFGARRHRGDLPRRPSRTISELSSPCAREQSSRGTVNARSSQSQAAVDMLQPCSQAQVSKSCEHTGRDVHRPRAERLRYIVSSDWRFGSKVERARSAFVDNPRYRLGTVIGVDQRNAQAPITRQKRPPRNRLHWHVVRQSVTQQPAGGPTLQDETGGIRAIGIAAVPSRCSYSSRIASAADLSRLEGEDSIPVVGHESSTRMP